MNKQIVISLTVIVFFGAFIYTQIGVPRVFEYNAVAQTTPHAFGEPDRPIAAIEAYAFYFVPKNKRPADSWNSTIAKNVADLEAFHALQFRNTSALRLALIENPVIGEEAHSAYDSDTTQFGNPNALLRIVKELERRNSAERFVAAKNGSYRLALIVYEGVGASGGFVTERIPEGSPGDALLLKPEEFSLFDGFLLINREYLSGKFGVHGTTFLAHEFYHALGAPDLDSGDRFSEDLMGLGRFGPLRQAYLDASTLRGFGI